MEEMNKCLAMCAAGAAAACTASALAAKDGIKDGVHGYTPKGYVQPKEPEVRERLEWFKDQKLALMMHWGLYSTIGLTESWPLSDGDARWSRREVDWTKDSDEFKRQYMGLARAFNPVRFEPAKWAKAAREDGFRNCRIDPADASRSSRRIIWPVTVVPTFAPTMMPRDCRRVMMPAPTRPEVMTIVAVEDWITAVITSPRRNALTGLLVTCSRAIFKVPDELCFNPSPMRRMP